MPYQTVQFWGPRHSLTVVRRWRLAPAFTTEACAVKCVVRAQVLGER
jgi:hypothetical protein